MQKITRYTTPTLTFSLPFEESYLKNVYVTIWQRNVSINKESTDCTISDKTISCELTQSETGQLEAGKETNIQVRYVGTDDKAYASERFKVEVENVLKEGVI